MPPHRHSGLVTPIHPRNAVTNEGQAEHLRFAEESVRRRDGHRKPKLLLATAPLLVLLLKDTLDVDDGGEDDRHLRLRLSDRDRKERESSGGDWEGLSVGSGGGRMEEGRKEGCVRRRRRFRNGRV